MLSIATLNKSSSLVCDRSFTLCSNFILQFSKIYKTKISKNVIATLKAGITIAATPRGDLCPPIVFYITSTDKGIVCKKTSCEWPTNQKVCFLSLTIIRRLNPPYITIGINKKFQTSSDSQGISGYSKSISSAISSIFLFLVLLSNTPTSETLSSSLFTAGVYFFYSSFYFLIVEV